MKIVTGRYLGPGNFEILNRDFSVSFTAQKDYPPELVTQGSLYENELFVIDAASGKPLAGVPVEVVCVSGTCPKNHVAAPLAGPSASCANCLPVPVQDGTHYVSDEHGRFVVSLYLGTAGEKVITGLQASGDKFKSPVVELVFDATTVPTKGMVCVVNLSGSAFPYSDQFASILYGTFEQAGFPLFDKNIKSGEPNQVPVDSNLTLDAMRSAASDMQRRMASMQDQISQASRAGAIIRTLSSPTMIAGNAFAFLAAKSQGGGSYKMRVKVNGPGENTDWAYLELWNTDCKMYNPGDVVAIYMQHHTSESSFYKIADFPLTIKRGHVHIVEANGNDSSPNWSLR